jgi:ribosomal protein S18 acetylase RimI-like enzyme
MVASHRHDAIPTPVAVDRDAPCPGWSRGYRARVTAIKVRAAADADRGWVAQAARDHLGDVYQVHLRRQFLVTDGEVLVAERDGLPVGFLTWVVEGDACEALAIVATERGSGVGRALMGAFHRLAAARGSARLRVVTTDTNAGAQRFYERLGYQVVEVRPGAVDECRRRYKPEIPPDMHDEIEYGREVT